VLRKEEETMKKTFLKFALIFLVLTVTVNNAGSAGAATFYIRDGGTSSFCTDWTNACDALPAILQRGATYYIADGTYGSNTFDAPNSGTTLITVKKATIADHGTDTGWQDAYGDGTAVFDAPLIFSTDYYVIDGQTRNSDWRSGYSIKIDNSAVDNGTCAVCIGTSDADPASHITLKHVELEGSGDLFTDSINDTGVRMYRGANAITMQYCAVHRQGNTNFHWRNVSNVILEYCWIGENDSESAGAHAEGISMSDGIGRLDIRYNLWENVEGTAIIATPKGPDNDPNPGPWNIHGNVFYYTADNCTTGTGRSGVSAVLDIFGVIVTGEVNFFNNAIANINASSACNQGGAGNRGRISVTVKNGIGTVNTLRVRNNLVWNSDPGGGGNWMDITADIGILQSTHWAFYDVGDTQDAEVDQATKQVSTGNPFAGWTNRNFHLTNQTNAGFNTASELSVNSFDADGNTRGADGTWDRGAYEFGGTGDTMPPSPPTGLRVN
jgi:hypothetical protein